MNRNGIIGSVVALGAACAMGEAAVKTPNPLEGKSVKELTEVLTASPDEIARHNAVQAITAAVPEKKRTGRRAPKEAPDYTLPDARTVAILVGGLGDRAGGVRHACREALGRCGAVAIDPLVKALESGNIDLRCSAADALGDLGVYDDADTQPLERAVPGLVKLLGDENYAVRVSAAMALSRIGARSAPALSKLIPLLDDAEWAVADAAVRAVAAADPEGKQSVPALAKVLGNETHDLREFVCVELAEMGPKAEGAIPVLIKLLDTDRNSWQAGKAAAGALGAIVSVDPKNPEAPGVSDETRTIVITAIAGSAAAQKVPFMQDGRLFALLPKLPTQNGAHHYEGPLGREALPALPVAMERLQQWMRRGSAWIPRRQLVEFIGEVGKFRKDEVIPVVKALLADEKLDPKSGRVELEGLLKKLEL